ncbi:prepilin peptidase CpaA [Sphingomonas palmae]|uniref:Prepilin peptidase CpaA n=1 Tax=Sphingomonas palmae TaxID=1855283 RepID=A0A1H7P5W8_9SPHN|nr:prepilin peptidase [Sphingomonas palmae]SEL30844.1 prepilin peptidase CpaA [Sphingomonas palmae]
MGLGILSWALPACLGVLLVSAGIEDARTREIANWKNAAIALLAPVWWFAIGLDPWPMMAIQLGVALFVFALFCGAFALGQMGGGDVKLIGALALWLTPMNVMNMLIVMSIAGGALTVVFLLDHKLLRREGAIEIPYGVAIALAGLLALREPLVNQFT